MTQHLILPSHVARRLYGDVIRVRAAHAVARQDRHDNRVTLGIWLGLATLACYLVAAYAVGAFSLLGWL